ncbi:hypothetical protein H6P81_018604 [Aristolochia fimbriata]|uniref:Uncharacterized protein n=1 Tax=Aristolochia fimbriata TaxID=158543 RepID=A0AAV7E3P7_ARIFI|nr:hypothetical protein H6P81_018604 [Aristolochia fimbriata]
MAIAAERLLSVLFLYVIFSVTKWQYYPQPQECSTLSLLFVFFILFFSQPLSGFISLSLVERGFYGGWFETSAVAKNKYMVIFLDYMDGLEAHHMGAVTKVALDCSLWQLSDSHQAHPMMTVGIVTIDCNLSFTKYLPMVIKNYIIVCLEDGHCRATPSSVRSVAENPSRRELKTVPRGLQPS